MKKLFLFVTGILLGVSFQTYAQSSSHIKLAIEKLSNTGRVLYLAAHPDDENTRLISYLENDLHIRTAYLSLTRGDGGQNLIGTEKGATLGMLRTQELLEARKLDGAEQFFTRAVDFGYSKNAAETFTKWNKDSILHDVVWVIRKFQPHTIITRFPPDANAGHGHHTASAMLAAEAFELAGNKDAFPEQLKHVDVWSPNYLLQNTSTWWDKDLAEKALSNDSIYALNVGGFNPLLGVSYGEIASLARSKHRCQGFGSSLQRGEKIEYVTLMIGKLTPAFHGLFSNHWLDLKNGKQINQLVTKLKETYRFENPEASLPILVKLLKALDGNEETWVQEKKEVLKEIILASSGVFEAWYSNLEQYAPQDSLVVEQRIIKRLASKLQLKNASFNGLNIKTDLQLNNEVSHEFITKLTDQSYTSPYFLLAPFENMYAIPNYSVLGLAENPSALSGTSQWEYEGYSFSTHKPVQFNYVDKSIGEITTPIQVIPKISLAFSKKVIITKNQKPTFTNITVSNNTNEDIVGSMHIVHNDHVLVKPSQLEINIAPHENQMFQLEILPNAQTVDEQIRFEFNHEKVQEITTIQYPHIAKQTWVSEAVLTIKNIPLQTGNEKIAYLTGSGDEVADYLTLMGYEVTVFEESALASFNPSQFDVVMLGIRALNVNKGITGIKEKLQAFVSAGGRLIMQYNTNRGLIEPYLGSASFSISRDRVTVEEAEATILNPAHPVLHFPNKINSVDFENWVQERGLYFADAWDKSFEPIISWNDPDEEALNGGLIIAKQGKGSVIYTGISFFRQLPAGVPGSYRLLSNLISFHYE